MADKVSIAVITARLNKHRDAIADMVVALQEGGFIILEIKEWEKTKQGHYLTWLSIEKVDTQWCNVCGEHTLNHRMRCQTCGAKRGTY